MVYPDIESTSLSEKPGHRQYYLATVADRFLAFIIDVFLFFPILGLFAAGQLRDVREYALQKEDSPEAFVVWLLFVFSVVGFSILLQATFSYFWGASPGQKLLNLRVVSLSYDSRHRFSGALTFPQAFLRSLTWWLSLGFFGWPFLESFSHPQRRCLHDRASDTMLISVIPTRDAGPSRGEQQFVSSWFRMGFMGVLLFFGLYYIKVHQMVRGGLFTKEELAEKGYLCDVDLPANAALSKRLDVLLTMQILEEGDEECLDMESDLALWNKEPKDKAMGYLVKVYLTSDKDEKSKYHEYLCKKFPASEECLTSSFFIKPDKFPADELRKKGLTLVTSRFLLLKNVMFLKNYPSAAALIDDLMKENSLRPHLQKIYVRLAWQVHEAQSGRAPASHELQEIVSEFKKRYGIP